MEGTAKVRGMWRPPGGQPKFEFGDDGSLGIAMGDTRAELSSAQVDQLLEARRSVLRRSYQEQVTNLENSQAVSVIERSLNDLVHTDPAAMDALAKHHVPCNRAVEDHPYAAAEPLVGDPDHSGLGLVGVLQALVGPLGARMYAVFDSDSQQLRSFRSDPSPRKDPEEMWDYLQSVIVFAARYTHSRATGGAGLVISLINQEWRRMSEGTRRQLLQESYEATENIREWAAFRETHTAG